MKNRRYIVLIAVLAAVAIGIALFLIIPRAPERDRQMYLSEDIIDGNTSGLSNVLWCKTKDSGMLDAIGYEKKENVLFVIYQGDKTVYAYIDVPENKWSGLISANFIDRYFKKNIQENYLHRSTKLRCKG